VTYGIDFLSLSTQYLSLAAGPLRDEGLCLLARLGAYAIEEEREAILLWPSVREGRVQADSSGSASISDGAMPILVALWRYRSSPAEAGRHALETGDISLGRVVYCILREHHQGSALTDAEACVMRTLRRDLPPEALEHVRPGRVSEAAVATVFRQRL